MQKKELKEMRTISEVSGTLKTRGQEEEEKEKRPEKIFEDITVKNFQNMGKQRVKKSRKFRESQQDKPKEKHNERHVDQTKIHKHTHDIKSRKGTVTNKVQGNAHNIIS